MTYSKEVMMRKLFEANEFINLLKKTATHLEFPDETFDAVASIPQYSVKRPAGDPAGNTADTEKRRNICDP